MNVVYKSTLCSGHFFLQLKCSEHAINCPTLVSKATLPLWQQVMLKVLGQAVKKNPGKDLPYYAE